MAAAGHLRPALHIEERLGPLPRGKRTSGVDFGMSPLALKRTWPNRLAGLPATHNPIYQWLLTVPYRPYDTVTLDTIAKMGERMRRRHFHCLFGALLGAAPLPAFGQSKVTPIIGVLLPVGEDGARPILAALHKGLANYGFVDGDTIRVLVRYADNKLERLTDLARDLKAQGSRMIVAAGTTTVEAAHLGAPDLPIVMAGSADPVLLRLAESLARPGGRITGISIRGEAIIAKNLQLLNELLNGGRTFAAFLQASNPGNPTFRKAFGDISQALGVRINIVEIADPVAEFPGAFERTVQQSAVGALILADPLFFTHRETIFRLALDHRLPTVGPTVEYAKAGCLLAYALDYVDMWRQSARYISEILRGADPATLPIEEPTAFHFAVNVHTARALGIEIPPSFLVRADEVIN